MPKILISYSRVDQLVADEIVRLLRRMNGDDSVWIDRDLTGGDDWWAEILRQIALADAVVYLLSPESAASSYCQAELTEAHRLKKPIIMVQVRARTPIPPHLAHLQMLELHDPRDSEQLVQLQRAVSKYAQPARRTRPRWAGPTPLPTPSNPPSPPPTPPPAPPARKMQWRGIGVVLSSLVGIALAFLALYPDDARRGALESLGLLQPNDPATSTLTAPPSATATLSLPTPLTPTDTPPTTPTDSPTLTPSPRPSQTDLPTASPSPTLTETPTASPTPSSTPTDTLTPTYAPTRDPANPAALTCPDDMVAIEATTFMMGLEIGAYGPDNERPAHSVTLDAYCIDRTEVTNTAYLACMNSGQCSAPSRESSKTRTDYLRGPFYGAFPVINVTWEQAQTFCQARGGRLPTEAEWELAARYNPTINTMNPYPWGNIPASAPVANYAASGFGDTVEVGQFPLGDSPLGVADMAGNVAEWVFDWYGVYTLEAAVNPALTTPEPSNMQRVVRGGSFASTADAIRGGYRDSHAPTVPSNEIGFRCVTTGD